MILYAFDSEVAGRYRAWKRHAAVRDVKRCYFRENTPPENIVKGIIHSAGKRQSIWLLILVAHGNPGSLSLGGAIDVRALSKFAPLRDYMTPGGPGIEVHGCGIASDTRLDRHGRGSHLSGRGGVGYNWVSTLARTVGVPVTAGLDDQILDELGRLEGTLITVQPDGSGRFWKAPPRR